MRKITKVRTNDIDDFADDARALMDATAKVAGRRVERARNRLSIALKRGEAAAEDAVDTSADFANDTIHDLRQRITDALDHGKEIYDDVHDDLVTRTKEADHTVRENPYQVMGIALGVGALVGFFLSFRHSRNGR